MKKTNKQMPVIIDENTPQTLTVSDIETLINRVDKLSVIMDYKMDKLIERLDKILIANGINWYTLMLK